jgi:hypothetical protein
VHQVGDAPAPARGIAVVGTRGLPDIGLVLVREQLRRQRDRALLVSQLRGRADQRADVRDDAGLAAVEQARERAHLRMQAVQRAVAR